MRKLRALSIAALMLHSGELSLNASVITTFPAFAARTTDQPWGTPYYYGQSFVATPGAVSLSAFTFYVRPDPEFSLELNLDFFLYQWDGFAFGDLLFTGTPTITPDYEPPGPSGSATYLEVTMDTGALPVTPGHGYIAGIGELFEPFYIGTTRADLYPEGLTYQFKSGHIVLSSSDQDLAFTARFVGGVDRIYGNEVPEPKLGPAYLWMILVLLTFLSRSLTKNRESFDSLTKRYRLHAMLR